MADRTKQDVTTDEAGRNIGRWQLLKRSMVGGALIMMALAMPNAAAATPNRSAVPELDPGSASMGVALLAGGLLAFNGRRRKP